MLYYDQIFSAWNFRNSGLYQKDYFGMSANLNIIKRAVISICELGRRVLGWDRKIIYMILLGYEIFWNKFVGVWNLFLIFSGKKISVLVTNFFSWYTPWDSFAWHIPDKNKPRIDVFRKWTEHQNFLQPWLMI